MSICENEPKTLGPDNGKVQEMKPENGGNGQSAAKDRDEIQLTWLACAIESEGSIQLAWGGRKDGYVQLAPRVNLCNNAIEYLEKAMSISTGAYLGNKRADGCRYVIWFGFKRVKTLLESILPYMVIERKKTIVGLVLEFINYRLSVTNHVRYGQKEKDIFLKIRELNGHGRTSSQELRFRFDNAQRLNDMPVLETVKI